MRQKSGPVKEPAEKVVKDIRRATRRQFLADLTYEELASRLNVNGRTETEAPIANKLHRGAFTITFFLAS